MEQVEQLEQAGTYWNKVEQKIFISTMIFNIVPDVPPVLLEKLVWLYGINEIFFDLLGWGLPAGHKKAPEIRGLSKTVKFIY